MMDVAAILRDTELGGTAFTVVRRIWRQKEGESVPLSTARSTATGCVHPGTPETPELLPEEDRRETHIVVYTSYPLSTGVNDGITWQAADEILYDDSCWRVVQVKDWRAQGFVKALAVQVRGGDSG